MHNVKQALRSIDFFYVSIVLGWKWDLLQKGLHGPRAALERVCNRDSTISQTATRFYLEFDTIEVALLIIAQ